MTGSFRTRAAVLTVALVAGAAGLAAGAPAEPTGKAPAKGIVMRHPMLNILVTVGFGNPEWQKAAVDTVMKSWKPKSVPPPGTKTIIILTVARDGRITSAVDDQRSGIKEWDEAVIDALRATPKLPPLPRSWHRETLDVHLVFGTNDPEK